MDFEVYCDESRPELFVAHPGSQLPHNALIGSVWIPSDLRPIVKGSVKELRNKYNIRGEAKWTKVTPSSLAFYKDFVDLVLTNPNAHFRCIVVDAEFLDLERFHANDPELGFYKFYYQLIVHRLAAECGYRIFCDSKVNRDTSRLRTLKTILQNARPKSRVSDIESVKSSESSLVQLCDVLVGAVQSKFNQSNRGSSAKAALLQHIEYRLGGAIAPTFRSETQFNVFKIMLTPTGGQA